MVSAAETKTTFPRPKCKPTWPKQNLLCYKHVFEGGLVMGGLGEGGALVPGAVICLCLDVASAGQRTWIMVGYKAEKRLRKAERIASVWLPAVAPKSLWVKTVNWNALLVLGWVPNILLRAQLVCCPQASSHIETLQIPSCHYHYSSVNVNAPPKQNLKDPAKQILWYWVLMSHFNTSNLKVTR